MKPAAVLAKRLVPNCWVFIIGCSKVVNIVENGRFQSSISSNLTSIKGSAELNAIDFYFSPCYADLRNGLSPATKQQALQETSHPILAAIPK